MHRTKKLAFNTILFAISNFGSKALSFLLVPFYTAVLSTQQYGTVDLILTINSLLIPVVTLSIADAVLRFSMDPDNNKSDVYLTGICITGAGGFLSLLMLWLCCAVMDIREYWLYMTLILTFNVLYLVSSQFCRGISKTVHSAVGGIVQTAVFIGSNLLFLLVMKQGIKGYLLSLLISFAAAFLYLFFGAGLYRCLRGHLHKGLFRQMVKYSIPLIPNTILWWVMTASDKLFIADRLGKEYNGLYAVANKLPSIINIISAVFFQAWQLSAIEESEAQDRNSYYSSAFKYLSTVVMISMSGILLILRPLFTVWTAESYHSAWQYTPLLLFAVMFMCFSSFWGANLVALKQTSGVLKSVVAGGVLNLVLNAVLIPVWGLYGAALATLIGFLITWIVRYAEGRKHFTIRLHLPTNAVTLLLLMLQTGVLFLPCYWAYEIVLCGLVLCVNRRFVARCLQWIHAKTKNLFTRGKVND